MKKTENFEKDKEINKNGNEVEGISLVINKEIYKLMKKKKMKIGNTNEISIEIKEGKK